MRSNTSKLMGCNRILHFTSLGSCEKILESRELRLSSCNDMKNYDEETKALYTKLIGMNKWDDSEKEKLYQRYSCRSIKDTIDKLIVERKSTFMFCFTINDKEKDLNSPDDSYDFLWKYYADKSKGVAIEFDKCKINPRTGSSRGCSEYGSRLFAMEYEGDILKCLKQPQLVDSLYLNAYKPTCCKLENEVRLGAYLGNDISNVQRITHEYDGSCGNRSFRKDGNYIYYDITNQDGNDSAITKIYCKSKETEEALKNFANKLEIEIIVQHIKSPF